MPPSADNLEVSELRESVIGTDSLSLCLTSSDNATNQSNTAATVKRTIYRFDKAKETIGVNGTASASEEEELEEKDETMDAYMYPTKAVNRTLSNCNINDCTKRFKLAKNSNSDDTKVFTTKALSSLLPDKRNFFFNSEGIQGLL